MVMELQNFTIKKKANIHNLTIVTHWVKKRIVMQNNLTLLETNVFYLNVQLTYF